MSYGTLCQVVLSVVKGGILKLSLGPILKESLGLLHALDYGTLLFKNWQGVPIICRARPNTTAWLSMPSRTQPCILVQPHLSPNSTMKAAMEGLTADAWTQGEQWGALESRAVLSTLPPAQQATPQRSQELQLCWHFKGAPFGTTNEECHLHLVFSRHQFLAGKHMLLMCQPLFSGCYSTWSRQWMGSNITPWYHIGHGLLSNFWRGMWDYVW